MRPFVALDALDALIALVALVAVMASDVSAIGDTRKSGKVALKINCAYFTFTSDGRGVQPNQANQSLHLKCLVIFVIPFAVAGRCW